MGRERWGARLRGGEGIAEGDSKGGGEGHKVAQPEGAIGARHVAPGVGGEEEGDLLEGGERRAGKGIVGEQGGEGGEDGEAEGGMVGAGEEHVDFIAEGVGGATVAGPGGVRDMAASGEGQKAVGGEVAALAAQPEERDGRVGGKEPEVEGGLVEVGPLEVGRV